MRRRFINKSGITFDYTNYMTIEALENEVSISFPQTIEYGINGVGWKKLYKGQEIVINRGVFLSVKYSLPEGSEFGSISISGSCNLKGNCLSLVFYDAASKNNNLSTYSNCLKGLFSDCKGIKTVDADFLLATTLASSCYFYMFKGCTSLTTAPELPATTLDTACYFHMFYNCTSLTNAPSILPATTLASNCYNSMFYGCTSLTTAPILPATTLAERCYCNMFDSCTSLVYAPNLPATNLAEQCYQRMFGNCRSLTTAPDLPATKLAKYCYEDMFYGCSNLNYIKAMFTTTPSTSYTLNWVYGVASSGTFVKNKNATWSVTGVDGIPSGWTVQTA